MDYIEVEVAAHVDGIMDNIEIKPALGTINLRAVKKLKIFGPLCIGNPGDEK
jgi:hypothetical protein